jgi:hypothetical protein
MKALLEELRSLLEEGPGSGMGRGMGRGRRFRMAKAMGLPPGVCPREIGLLPDEDDEVLPVEEAGKGFGFASEKQAWAFLNWLTKKGFDDYGGVKPKKTAGEWTVPLLPSYSHHDTMMQKVAAKVREKVEATEAEKPPIPDHYRKDCSTDAQKANVRYFVHKKNMPVKQAVAASLSALKTACGKSKDFKGSPKDIVGG